MPVAKDLVIKSLHGQVAVQDLALDRLVSPARGAENPATWATRPASPRFADCADPARFRTCDLSAAFLAVIEPME
jgi:hypothetical protein